MLRSPTVCRERGCHDTNVRGSHWCAKHEQSNSFSAERNFERKNDAVTRMYWREPWPTFRKMLLAHNPLCQRINRGVQCTEPATLVHHLVSPRVRPDLFVVVSNVVALCAACHPTSEGTTWWREGVEFVRTEWKLPSF
jgi:hypothetical protein